MVVASAGQEISGDDWDGVFVIDGLHQLNFFRRNGSPTLPLFEYSGADNEMWTRKANISPSFSRSLVSSLSNEFDYLENAANIEDWDGCGNKSNTIGPREIFDWIYAVLHSPLYRSNCAKLLKSSFPHIPLPKDGAIFLALATLGSKLVSLHLLRVDEVPQLHNPDVVFLGSGEARVERGYPKFKNGNFNWTKLEEIPS